MSLRRSERLKNSRKKGKPSTDEHSEYVKPRRVVKPRPTVHSYANGTTSSPTRKKPLTNLYAESPAASSGSSSAMIGIVALVLLALAGLAYSMLGGGGGGGKMIPLDPNADQLLDTLLSGGSSMTAQPSSTRERLSSIPMHLAQPSPSRPLCMVAAHDESDAQAHSTFAKEVFSSVLPDRNRLLVFEGKFGSLSSDQQASMVESIGQRIEEHLKGNQPGVIMIGEVDKLKGPISKLLWRICDDDTSPYNKAIFYLTTSTGNSAIDSCTEETWSSLEADTAEHLKTTWQHKHFDPLWVRISNVFVVPTLTNPCS